jgi:putative serine protease PepD
MEPSNFENQIYTYTPVTAAPQQRRGWSAIQALVVVALVAFAALGGGIAGSVLTARTVLTMMPKAQVVTAQAPAQPVVQVPIAAASDGAASGASLAGAVYRKVGGSVVEISAGGTGSGIVVDASGLILTNYHVVSSVLRSRTQKITVRFGSGETRTAKLTQSDQANDLAVLKVDLPSGVPVATLAALDAVAVGDFIVAIGNHSVWMGPSPRHRQLGHRAMAEQTDLIQVDAAINPGNSGGRC